jgi:phosphoglycolate phosphatase
VTAATGTAAVLFDLDGTLLDTAPDLARAVNRQRRERGLHPVALERLRPAVSQGARGMLRVAFDLLPGHDNYEPMREEFLAYYLADLCVDTRLFPGMETVLRTLEARGLAWGIVTNKLHRFTQPLLEQMQLHERAACIVSGDTTARPKPHPDPLLEAARRIDVAPSRCLYIGDDERDVLAANAAGMTAVVALWGYLGEENPPDAWGANHLKSDPEELLGLL